MDSVLHDQEAGHPPALESVWNPRWRTAG